MRRRALIPLLLLVPVLYLMTEDAQALLRGPSPRRAADSPVTA